ncbi:hypothetical protein, partial [Comamonas testosteroni]|uniref:hypothetical protein n=1 Tax=Comamonas testosteroni TaxID=285 RepID=UPI0005B4FED9
MPISKISDGPCPEVQGAISYQRYVAFWRDMWSIILEPISELPPSPSSFEQEPSAKPEAQQPAHHAEATTDKA